MMVTNFQIKVEKTRLKRQQQSTTLTNRTSNTVIHNKNIVSGGVAFGVCFLGLAVVVISLASTFQAAVFNSAIHVVIAMIVVPTIMYFNNPELRQFVFKESLNMCFG